MVALLVTLHILASLVLILVVLLQSGKAGDLASAFGGAGSQTDFGARGAATFLTKATTLSAVVFMLTSLSLAVMFTQGGEGTVLDTLPIEEGTSEEPAGDLPIEEPALPTADPTAEPAADGTSDPAAAEEASEPGAEVGSQDPQ